MSQKPPFDLSMLGDLGSQMSENMGKMEAKLSKEKIEVQTGGGLVKAVFTANLKMKSLVLDDALIKMDDKEMTEDLIVAAVNSGIDKAQARAQEVTMELLGPLGMMMQDGGFPFGGDK